MIIMYWMEGSVVQSSAVRLSAFFTFQLQLVLRRSDTMSSLFCTHARCAAVFPSMLRLTSLPQINSRRFTSGLD